MRISDWSSDVCSSDLDSGADAPVASRLPPLWLLALMQGSVAAASLVVEIVAGRMLAPYLGMSLYTWTVVIAVVLAGFSLGHCAGGSLAERSAARALGAMGGNMAAAARNGRASCRQRVVPYVEMPLVGV